MPINEIKPFATSDGANVISQSAYEALATTVLANGFSSGIAESAKLNKVWRQASFVAAAIAQFIADKSGQDVLDNGDVAGLATKLTTALNAVVPDATTTTKGRIRVATSAEAIGATATNIAVDPAGVAAARADWEKTTTKTAASTLPFTTWGGFVELGGSATYTTTLPAARNGGRMVFWNYSNYDQTLALPAGNTFIGLYGSGANTMTLASGRTLTIVSDGINYVATAYSVVMSDAAPTGKVAHFATSTAPAGWLKANGAAVSRTAYAALFAVIGTTYGAGDGSTTFNLPDLRGEFIRCLDGGRGVDAGRLLGSWQADEFRSHIHELEAGYNDLVTSTNPNTNDVGRPGGTLSSGYNTRPAGGAETRPRNVALLACIKY